LACPTHLPCGSTDQKAVTRDVVDIEVDLIMPHQPCILFRINQYPALLDDIPVFCDDMIDMEAFVTGQSDIGCEAREVTRRDSLMPQHRDQCECGIVTAADYAPIFRAWLCDRRGIEFEGAAQAGIDVTQVHLFAAFHVLRRA